MRTLPFAQAFELLSSATAVRVDNDSLVYPELFDPADEECDEAGLFMSLAQPGGAEYFATATQAEVEVDERGNLIFWNTAGQKTLVQPLAAALALPKTAGPAPAEAVTAVTSAPPASDAGTKDVRLDLSTDLTLAECVGIRMSPSGMFVGLLLPDETILRPILTFEKDPQGSGENPVDLTVKEIAALGIEVIDARQTLGPIE